MIFVSKNHIFCHRGIHSVRFISNISKVISSQCFCLCTSGICISAYWKCGSMVAPIVHRQNNPPLRLIRHRSDIHIICVNERFISIGGERFSFSSSLTSVFESSASHLLDSAATSGPLSSASVSLVHQCRS